MKSKHESRMLAEQDKQSIREQIADGVPPREKIANEMRVSLRQVDGFKAWANNKWLSLDEMITRAHRYAVARARVRGETALTLEDCFDLLDRQGRMCALSGKRFSNKRATNNARILAYPWRPSLDRKSNRKGYSKSNVQIVTQWVNFARGEWPDRVFRDMCAAVVEHSEAKAETRASPSPRKMRSKTARRRSRNLTAASQAPSRSARRSRS